MQITLRNALDWTKLDSSPKSKSLSFTRLGDLCAISEARAPWCTKRESVCVCVFVQQRDQAGLRALQATAAGYGQQPNLLMVKCTLAFDRRRSRYARKCGATSAQHAKRAHPPKTWGEKVSKEDAPSPLPPKASYVLYATQDQDSTENCT